MSAATDAKGAGIPLNWTMMRASGVRVTGYRRTRTGAVATLTRGTGAKRETSEVTFQRVGGKWVYVGQSTAFRKVGAK